MRLRVLHLEDNHDDVELIRATLARQGLECEIFPVNSGTAYLAALQYSSFDLILSDSGVPGYSGTAALSAARERHPDVPFIVLSANPGIADDRANISPGGASGYVAKSELERLAPLIRHVLPKPLPTATDSTSSQLRALQLELKRRTAELAVLNKELEAFSYSVAHDLRSPLITIDGFSQVLVETAAERLDEVGRDHLERISAAVRRMHRLLNDLLELSKIVRAPMHRMMVDLSRTAREIIQGLNETSPERDAEFIVADQLSVEGDSGLLRIALENLLSNAWKFTARQAHTRIEFGARTDSAGATAYYVRDNGVGFDPQYAAKLFSPFQRLHPQSQFPGTGIGLATVQRIIHRHGGHVWAESDAEHGACFYFTLP